MHVVCVRFDPAVYRITAVKKAGYRFGDRCFVEISVEENGGIQAVLGPKPGCSLSEHLEGEFRNEVLDQELREAIATETEPIRNLILAQAFSQVSVIDKVGEDGDFRDDPLGIASTEKLK